jgi:hypothetical protein
MLAGKSWQNAELIPTGVADPKTNSGTQSGGHPMSVSKDQ